MKKPALCSILVVPIVLCTGAAAATDYPVSLSPGSVNRIAPVTACPTFSWTPVAGAEKHKLVVYGVEGTDAFAEDGAEPHLQISLPGAAASWTPSLDGCLSAGRTYAWAVRAVGSQRLSEWSKAKFFRVAPKPSVTEVEEALRVLHGFLANEWADRRNNEDGGEAVRRAAPANRDLSVLLQQFRFPPPASAEAISSLPSQVRPVETGGRTQVVTPPVSLSFAIDGDFDLGGSLFKGGEVFLHNDGGIAADNTSLGVGAMVNLQPDIAAGGGIGNTAIGARALRSAGFASYNTAVGSFALESNTMPGNTAVGSFALQNNTTGFFNSAFGAGALVDNTVGGGNTAIGLSSLADNTAGSGNTAVGFGSLSHNATGVNNSASGAAAMFFNMDGSNNTANGAFALELGFTGSRNTAMGVHSLFNSAGSDNIALGYRAGFDLFTGSDNILVGNLGAEESNSIRVGNSTVHLRTFIAGIQGVTTDVDDAIPVLIDSNGQLGTTSSSRRYKKEIEEMGAASSRLLDLRPVTFKYKKEPVTGTQSLQFGLVAEEVAEFFPELVVYDVAGRPETVKYHLLSSMLLNELQKQQQEIQRLAARLASLEPGFSW